MPTNRGGPFLAFGIDSLLAQTYSDWRLIVVDDGSPDPAALRRLASNVEGSTLLRQNNQGVSAARNAAIRAGVGEFVAFLDDDDVWPPERLSILVDALRRSPSASGAFGNGRYVNAKGVPFGRWETRPASQEEFLRRQTPIPRIAALMVRRAALENVGLFDESMKLSEDDELILRLLRHAPMVHANSDVVNYRRHSENASSAVWRERYQGGRKSVILNIKAARNEGNVEHEMWLREYLARLDRSTAGASVGRIIADIREKKYISAFSDFGSSIRISPRGFLVGGSRRILEAGVRRVKRSD